jgi:ferric-dicitrate binding protein FerR (iron transport regulator)
MIHGGDRIESLIDAVIDGRCDEAGLRRLAELVRDDPRAREAYLDQMRMHALLEWRHGRVGMPADRGGPRRRPRFRPGGRGWGIAAVVLIGVGLIVLTAFSAMRGRRAPGVATLIEAKDVVWAEGQPPIGLNSRLEPRAIRCDSGTLRLSFDSGAMVTLEGPADLRILSGMRLRALRGRITARMKGDTKGFTVETPSTLVVDQGTEFGVEVDASGRTGVVVFEGLVDLSCGGSPGGPGPTRRLGQGEGMRVDPAGAMSRIIAVERRPGDDGWSTDPTSDGEAIIRSVRDNIRGLDSSKYYQIVPRGLAEDAPAYVDRPHEWNGVDPTGLPAFLRGADYIMPFNDDKFTSGLEITVEMSRAATLFVFLDDREKPQPWLTSRFADTGVKIGLDEQSWPDPTLFTVDRGPGRSINHVFSVWKRDVSRDEAITLGGLQGGRNDRAMYGIAAVPRP